MIAPRVALISGGGSGIGRASALVLAKRGINLVVADLNEEAADAVAAEVGRIGTKGIAVRCDVAEEASVAAAVAAAGEYFGRLDIVIASAGVDLHKDIEGTTVAEWQRVLAINVTGAFLCIKYTRPMMIANRFGRIICLGSSSGIYGMGWPAYSTSKAALHGLVLAAARELAPFGITANVVVPGPTETPLSTELWNNNPGRRDRLTAMLPVGRVAVAEEIAEAVAYLASDQAGYVTGSSLVIDGGLTSLLCAPTRSPAV